MTKTTSSLPLRLRIDHCENDTLTGQLLSGEVSAGDEVVALPGGILSTVEQVDIDPTDPQRRSLRLTAGVRLQVGQVLAASHQRPEYADQFTARLLWNSSDPLLPGRLYRLRSATCEVQASVSKLKYQLTSSSKEQFAVNTLQQGETGVGNLALSAPMVYDPEAVDPATARFELTDPASGVVVAEGMILHGLRRASNVHWQALDVDKVARAAVKNQTPCVVWLTGLSASGKSTIANLVEKRLLAAGKHAYLLDGDNIRHGLNKDLGFTQADRVENIRRVAEISRLMVDAGLIVITSFISPFRAERDMARGMFPDGEFIEVFVDTPLALCEQRDPKGLYQKARRGEIENFTGLDSPYEAPEHPELHLRTAELSAEDAADNIVSVLGIR